nr:glycosyltransferase family A protein [Microbacterium sp. Gd 4-13]
MIVPSVGRPRDAQQAVESVRRAIESRLDPGLQIHVIVVHREDDLPTHAAAVASGARPVHVSQAGLAHAMRAGAEASTAEVVAFLDDDARMRPDWFDHVAPHYDNPRVGGVGGADVQPNGYAVRIAQDNIGQIDRFGRVLGGHHQATGSARVVSHLKGANCSFRRESFIRWPYQGSVAGRGAQARNEFIASLAIHAQGLDLILDPEAVVDHYPAPREAGDARGDASKAYETAYNEVFGFAMSDHPRRLRNMIFLATVGYRNTPGMVRLLLRQTTAAHVKATLSGLTAGHRAGRQFRHSSSAEASR